MAKAPPRSLTAIMLVPAMLAGICTAGCNTAAGFGQDLQAAGRALTRSADHIAGSDTAMPTASTEPSAGSGSSSPR
jgi:predicted small secreted protein